MWPFSARSCSGSPAWPLSFTLPRSSQVRKQGLFLSLFSPSSPELLRHAQVWILNLSRTCATPAAVTHTSHLFTSYSLMELLECTCCNLYRVPCFAPSLSQTGLLLVPGASPWKERVFSLLIGCLVPGEVHERLEFCFTGSWGAVVWTGSQEWCRRCPLKWGHGVKYRFGAGEPAVLRVPWTHLRH